jgi:hypothetical protein
MIGQRAGAALPCAISGRSTSSNSLASHAVRNPIAAHAQVAMHGAIKDLARFFGCAVVPRRYLRDGIHSDRSYSVHCHGRRKT